MAGYVWWFVIGFGLLVAELLTGTFYLLIIAVAMGVAGIAAFLGASPALQFVIAAVIGLGGSVWLRSTRWGKRLHQRGDDRVQNMDLGQSLRVDGGVDELAAVAHVPVERRGGHVEGLGEPPPGREREDFPFSMDIVSTRRRRNVAHAS